MERQTIDSISFEFRQDGIGDPWILFAWFSGDFYICLTPFRLKMDARNYIIDALDHFTGYAHLEGEWELIWSDSPNFIDGQMRMNQEKLTDESYDFLPM